MTYRPDPEGTEVEILYAGANFKSAKVLEIGSGDGRLLFRYADSAARVVGCDPNMTYLGTALDAWPAALRDKIAMLQCRGEALPFLDRTFDIALLGWSL